MEIFKLHGSVMVDTSKANDELEKTGEKAEGVGGKLASAVGSAAKFGAGVAAAAGAAGAAFVGMASSYDTSFAKVNTLLSGTDAEIQAYKDKIIEASNATGVSVNDMSEAIYSAISAGVDQANAIDFVTQSLQLAKGGFTDTTTAVDILTTAINAYGLSADDASAVADKLITTQNLGKTTVDELASSMGKVIPTAKQFGVDLDAISSMYVTMTSNGIATAESTTYMNSMLNELGKSGTKADKALRQMTSNVKEGGMSFSDMMAEGWDLTDVLSLLDENASELGVSMLDMFGSAEAGKAAAVIWDNAEKYNNAMTAMADSAGATETAFATMEDTFEEKTNKLKTNLKNVGIEIGESLMPIVSNLLDFVSENMPVIQDFLSGFFEFFGGAVSGASEVIGELFAFIEPYIPEIIDTIQTIISSIIEKAQALWAYLQPFISMIVEMVSQYVGMLLDYWRALWAKIQPVLPSIVETFKFLFESIMSGIKAVWDFISPYIPMFYNIILSLVDKVIDLWLNHLKPMVYGIVDFISNVLWPTIKKIIELIAPYIEAFAVNIEGVIDGLMKTFGGLIDFLTGIFSGDFKKVWSGLSDFFGGIMDGLASLFKEPFNFIIDGINSFIRYINTLEVPDWVPVVGGLGFHFGEIPLLAKGGAVTGAGTAIVGEAGAEMISLPEGATVTPLNNNNNAFVETNKKLDTLASIMQGLSEQLANMGIYIDGEALVGHIANDMDDALGKMAMQAGRSI